MVCSGQADAAYAVWRITGPTEKALPMFDSVALMPHAVCWAASPRLVWTMVLTNFVTFVSYVSICFTLIYLVRRTRHVIARDWAYFIVGFALFIVACGSTHLMEVITTWIPIFWADAGTNLLTAVLSAYVALMLIRRAPAIGFAVNDYAARLASVEQERTSIRDRLLAARKLEDWSRMSATISHEVSNPLESIQNILYLIETSAECSKETVALAAQAGAEAGRVITLSRSMLSFHRESAKPERVDLRLACESVRFLLQTVIRERGVKFQIEGEGSFLVEAFPGETRQVVLNLARNACEAIATPGCRVTLSMAAARGGVELQVTDEGTGIPAEALPTLFTFGRTSKGESGNGLGLWSVKQILTRHGGEVKVDESYRAGARFVVWWPKTYSPLKGAQELMG